MLNVSVSVIHVYARHHLQIQKLSLTSGTWIHHYMVLHGWCSGVICRCIRALTMSMTRINLIHLLLCTIHFFSFQQGCKNCGFAFCSKCLTKKAVVPKLESSSKSKGKHHVCNKCYNILTGWAIIYNTKYVYMYHCMYVIHLLTYNTKYV